MTPIAKTTWNPTVKAPTKARALARRFRVARRDPRQLPVRMLNRISTIDPEFGVSALAETGVYEIRIYGAIGRRWDFWSEDSFGCTLERFTAEFDQIPTTASLIRVRINSEGGDVDVASYIINRLREHPAKIETINEGLAASCASMILACGDVRKAAEMSFVMVHEPETGAWGRAADLQAALDRLAVYIQPCVDLYTKALGVSEDQVRAWMAATTWWNAVSAKETGWVTEIIPVTQNVAPITACLRPGVYANAPAELLAAIEVETSPEPEIVPAPEPEVAPAPEPSPAQTDPLAAITALLTAQAEQIAALTAKVEASAAPAPKPAEVEKFDDASGRGLAIKQMAERAGPKVLAAFHDARNAGGSMDSVYARVTAEANKKAPRITNSAPGLEDLPTPQGPKVVDDFAVLNAINRKK